MKFVEPITEKSKVREIKNLMIQDGNLKMVLIFLIGCYTGLRISDILSLEYSTLKENISYITEQKTGKERRIKWHHDVKEVFNQIHDGTQTGYIFTSNSNRNKGKVWSSVYTGKAIKDYCELAGLHGRYNNHTLRKTFAYTLYQDNNHDLVLVQQALNHSKVETTRRYLGTYATETQKAIRNLDF